MQILKIVSLFLALIPLFAQAEPSSDLSLKVTSATLMDKNSFHASLVRQRGVGNGLEINLIAKNESQTTILELELWEATCFYTDVGGSLVQTCSSLQNIELEDGLGNDLNGGVIPMKKPILYPGEQVRISVFGHRPVDGTFKLRFDGVTLEGEVPD